MEQPQETPWVLLVYKIPREPTSSRATVWRKLKRLGALLLHDAVWHNHQTSHLYVAIEDPGVIDVLNTQTMTVEEQVQTEPGAHTTAFDMLRQRLYVFLPSCRVTVYEESEAK